MDIYLAFGSCQTIRNLRSHRCAPRRRSVVVIPLSRRAIAAFTDSCSDRRFPSRFKSNLENVKIQLNCCSLAALPSGIVSDRPGRGLGRQPPTALPNLEFFGWVGVVRVVGKSVLSVPFPYST